MVKEMVGGCCVCSDERGWDENPLVYCDGHGCNVAVHQACYGIVQVPKGPWFCRKCESQERIARVKCELCPMKEGALKRTDTGGWAHVLCALYIPEVRFGNVSTMEPIILTSVPHERFQKTCYLCEEHGRESKTSAGACMQCNKIGCRQAFHVTCAQAAKLLCEEQQGVSANTVKYVGYCSYHWNKKCKGVLVPRPNDRARSKAEGRTPVQKPDISKRPSVIGSTKSVENLSPAFSSKQKNRKPPSKTSDGFSDSLSAADGFDLSGSQQMMKTQKITSPLNTPSVRDHLPNFPAGVSSYFPFVQNSSAKSDTSSEPSMSNGVLNLLSQKSTSNFPQAQSSKEGWKSPPAVSTAKKSEKNAGNIGVSNIYSKSNSASSGNNASKKRKSNKSSSEEDSKKKQKTLVGGHAKKSSYSGGNGNGKGKMPVLPPSPFPPKVVPGSSAREIEIPTKLEDFLEFQWKQGVEFLCHQPGYLDVASLLSCLHQLKNENAKLEERLSGLVKRRDHLLLVNSRLSKPLNPKNSSSSPALSQETKKMSITPSSPEILKNGSVEKSNLAGLAKSPNNCPSETNRSTKDSHSSTQNAKPQESKIRAFPKDQQALREQPKESQRPRSQPETKESITKESLGRESPAKVESPPVLENTEKLREITSSPTRSNKSMSEGKLSNVSLSSVSGDRSSSRQSPKNSKSPHAGGGKSSKAKSQEQLYQQEHQKMIQQQHQQMKQQQLSRQKFQQSHLLPLQKGNQQFNQHFGTLFQLPGFSGSDQHAMHQSKQGQMSMNGSPQQFTGQAHTIQFPNFVPYGDLSGIHNVRMPGYMPVYPVENPLNKVMEDKMDASSGMDRTDRRN